MMRALTRPFRVIRARSRTLRTRIQHMREVSRGAKLPQRADRTPIFILGAPRSGTTLLYQLLVEGLDVGWLANAHMEAPGKVSTIERRDQPRAGRTPSDWESSHGATREPWGPSEAGEFWYRVFPREPHQLDEWDPTGQQRHQLRAMVRDFLDACSGPVVFKNVFNTLRVPLLADALPEARFILIERDVESNARSLLAGRAKRGDLDAWWSARPKGADELRERPPAEQVVWQVERMNQVAREELGVLHPERGLRITYDELCADPAGVVTRVHQWLRDGSCGVSLRWDAALPDSFDRRAGGVLAPELEAELVVALASAAAREDAR
jgi:hypothetical protein